MAAETRARAANAALLRSRGRLRDRVRSGLSPAILTLPALALLGVFFFWPLLGILLRSLDARGSLSYTSPQLTLANYQAAFEDQVFRQILGNTVIIALEATLFTVILAYPTAYLLARLPRRWAAFLLLLILVPFLTSILLRLYAFTVILGHRGLVNSVAGTLHAGPFDLLFNRQGAVIGMVDYLLPYLILILYGIMAGVDQTLITAAKSLGASSWHAFWTIFFALTLQGLAAGTLLVFVLGLGFFLTPAILGGAHDITVAVYIEQQVSLLRWGVASAMGIVLLVFTLLLFAVAVRLVGLARTVGAMSGGQRGVASIEPLRLTPFTVLLAVFVAGVILFLLLPLAIVIPASLSPTEFVQFPPRGFSMQWYQAFFTDTNWTDAATKSLVTAASVGVLSTVLALLTAVAIRRAGPTMRTLAQALVFAPLIVPVILTAIALFDVEGRLHLLDTNLGLVLAHAALAIPYAFVVTSVALAAVDANVEEAAWTLGATRSRAFFTTTLMIIAPSILGALALAFLTSWDEVVVALFQTGVAKTLPVLFFGYLETGFPPTGAAIGTMVMAVIGAGALLAVVLRRLRRLGRKTQGGGGLLRVVAWSPVRSRK